MKSMPKHWKVVPISEVIEGLYDGPHATPPVAETGPIFLGIGNITDDGHLDLSTVRHISEKHYPKWTKRVTPKHGDIVFTYEATLNRYALIPKGFIGCLGRRLALIRTNRNLIDTRFLYYSFFGPDWRATIEANKLSGATVDRIPLSKFPKFPIKIPPFSIQNRIASILSAYDDLIENNARRIAILEEMARRIYQEWFVNFRFPGHEKVRMVDSELGKIPKGWEVKELGELCYESTETLKPESIDPKCSYVGLEHIPRRSITLNQWTSADKAGSTKKVFRKNDILFGKIRPYFHKVAVAPIAGVCSTDAIVIRPVDGFSYPLVLFCVSSDEFVAHSVQTSNGTKMPRANWKVLVKHPVPIPPANLHGRFSELVMKIVEMTQNLTMKNINLRTQRDLLLPKLISGEIDVSNMDIPNLKDQAA